MSYYGNSIGTLYCRGRGSTLGCLWDVNSQSHGRDCTVSCNFAVSIWLPWRLGWIPFLFKREKIPKQTKKIVNKANVVSPVGRLEPSEKAEDPTKNSQLIFHSSLKRLKWRLKLLLVCSDSDRKAVSFVPTWIITFLIEVMGEGSRSRSLSWM